MFCLRFSSLAALARIWMSRRGRDGRDRGCPTCISDARPATRTFPSNHHETAGSHFLFVSLMVSILVWLEPLMVERCLR
ncbi:hypothetical protein SCHPADRAFT_560613 [Schizopora paradoxa]|uniref:Uncharacterized protein n=1 Tax=Schizopora paradoxa TaxID=27342 RepID=A0A0H2RCJ4_9AGAM|nr:hypothetical protein SCHPADRAFT_560613 [Schizopora paradoxa]